MQLYSVFLCFRKIQLSSQEKDPLQLSHGSPQDSVQLQEERRQNKHQNDGKNKSPSKPTHNSVRESENKSFYFKSKTISSKDRSITIRNICHREIN